MITEDSLDLDFWDLSLPVKAGVRYRTGPFAAYAVAGRTGTGFLPYARDEKIRFSIETREASLGMIWSANPKIGYAVEAGREWIEIADKYAAASWRGKVYLIADFR